MGVFYYKETLRFRSFASHRRYLHSVSPPPFQALYYLRFPSLLRVDILNNRWSSWLITAHKDLTSSSDKPDPRLATFLSGVTKGIEYFYLHIDEGIEYIAANLGYTAQDARDWLKTVEHVKDASKVERSMIENTVEILSKAGVVKGEVGVNDLVVKEAL